MKNWISVQIVTRIKLKLKERVKLLVTLYIEIKNQINHKFHSMTYLLIKIYHYWILKWLPKKLRKKFIVQNYLLFVTPTLILLVFLAYLLIFFHNGSSPMWRYWSSHSPSSFSDAFFSRTFSFLEPDSSTLVDAMARLSHNSLDANCPVWWPREELLLRVLDSWDWIKRGRIRMSIRNFHEEVVMEYKSETFIVNEYYDFRKF